MKILKVTDRVIVPTYGGRNGYIEYTCIEPSLKAAETCVVASLVWWTTEITTFVEINDDGTVTAVHTPHGIINHRGEVTD